VCALTWRERVGAKVNAHLVILSPKRRISRVSVRLVIVLRLGINAPVYFAIALGPYVRSRMRKPDVHFGLFGRFFSFPGRIRMTIWGLS
jgi:hypothetical protein